jgi:ATP-dependent helicase/nuclease subunit A
MNKARKVPVDQPVRDRLAREFDKNFLVEAGAGSGKTHSLATRMAAGVAAGIYTVDHMAVVTFTRKAAAELRGRFQIALEKRLRDRPPEAERRRLEAALAGMERLVAGTIHAFCARLLRERPVDARIAPGFEELSDIDNLQRQKEAWRDFVGIARASGSKRMLDLLEAGIRPGDLEPAFAAVCEHEDVEFDMGRGEPPDSKPVWREIDRFWNRLRALRPPQFHEKTTCPIQKRFDEFEGRLRLAHRDRLSSLADFVRAWGTPTVTQKYWGEMVGRPKAVGKQVKELVDRLQEEVLEPFKVQWRAYVHRLAIAVLLEARAFYAQERRRQNVVNYVDLLRVAAEMLRSSQAVRVALQRKYRFLFIDEFQDTDPIQAEIFLMLAGDGTGSKSEGPRSESPKVAVVDPFALALRPGALFVVGDPKQSIFRFRRADIDIYNRVAKRIRETGGEVLPLIANFRSLPGVCAVANTVFPPLFAAQSFPYSPRFARLDPVREEPDNGARRDEAERGVGAPASEEPGGVQGIPPSKNVARITIPDGGKGDRPHEEEARRIAAYIRGEVDSGRRAYGDFLALARQKPRLRVFADAFDALDIPVDVSGAGLFCDSQEVAALAALLGALADPLDSVALVGVLRGPLFGHSDPDLFRYRQADGRLELSTPLPEAGDEAGAAALDTRYGPVLQSLRRLKEMWQATRTLPLAAAVEQMLEQTGWLALAATSAAGAGAGHLLQAIDRVREVVEKGGGLAEAAGALNEEETSSEAEAMPLEPGRRNVVRLMNLHKAKGLEADVVFLADATHAYEFPIDLRIVRTDNDAAKGYLRIMRPADEPWKQTPLGQPVDWGSHEQEEQKYRDAERLRLLYVAGTRAKDLLVVCRNEKPSRNRAWDAFNDYVAGVPELAIPAATPPSKAATDASPRARQAAVTARGRRHDAVCQPSWAVMSVTRGKADGVKAEGGTLAERAKEAAEPIAAAAVVEATDAPVHRVDAGVAWGSLVHGLLEHSMRHEAASRADLERLARWLTEETPDLRPFIPGALDLVEAMSKAPFWQEARAAGQVHVEVPFAVRVEAGTRVGDGEPAQVPTVLHGVIDLVHRAADGWRILDYKTDHAIAAEQALLDRHGTQLAHYRAAWERVTGEKVAAHGVVAVRTGTVEWA